MPKQLLASCLMAGVWLGLMPSSALAQSCLHDRSETFAERQRRSDALIAVRLVNQAEASAAILRSGPRYRPLAELGDLVAHVRSDGGRLGKVARSIQWSSREILPGWVAEFVVADDGYALHLRDQRDTCAFTYVTDHTGVILTAYPIDRRQGPQPLDSD
jgi:hypothetical protein